MVNLEMILINDDIQKVTFKLKLEKFPLKLKRKLEHIAKSNGVKIETLLIFLIDNEVQSVEKSTGKINLD